MSFQLVQGLIISTIVGISLAMALRHFFPSWTGQLLGRLANTLLQQPFWLLRLWGNSLHQQISQAGGCGTDSGCGSCKGCSPSSPAVSPNSEVKEERIIWRDR